MVFNLFRNVGEWYIHNLTAGTYYSIQNRPSSCESKFSYHLAQYDALLRSFVHFYAINFRDLINFQECLRIIFTQIFQLEHNKIFLKECQRILQDIFLCLA